MEDLKIYIFVIQKSFLSSLGEISLVCDLHRENKMWYLLDLFFKSNAVSSLCFVVNSNVPSTKKPVYIYSVSETVCIFRHT
jgi:hypothetical protein